MSPVLISIHVGLPRSLGREDADDPNNRLWTTGSFKEPVEGPIAAGQTGLAGDGQADQENHGGPDKAICAYPADHYDFWRTELSIPEFPYGAFAENFTIGGLTEADVCIGDVWSIGPVTIQVSQPRSPCWKLARRWGITDLAGQVVANGRSGWYFRVLAEGVVSTGLPLALVERPFPQWTVARANRVLHHEKSDPIATAELASVPSLSTDVRLALERRAERLAAS